MAFTSVATDNFTRADGALGSNWTNLLPGTTSTPLITSNSVSGSLAHPASVWSGAGSFTDDQYAEAAIVAMSNQDDTYRSGVVVRASTDIDGGRDYYQGTISLDSATNYTVRITKYVNGTKTELSNSTSTWTSGDKIMLSVEGTSLKLYKNRVEIAACAVTDSSLTTGKPGLMAGCSYNSGIGIVDDWEGGNITGGGGTGIDPQLQFRSNLQAAGRASFF